MMCRAGLSARGGDTRATVVTVKANIHVEDVGVFVARPCLRENAIRPSRYDQTFADITRRHRANDNLTTRLSRRPVIRFGKQRLAVGFSQESIDTAAVNPTICQIHLLNICAGEINLSENETSATRNGLAGITKG